MWIALVLGVGCGFIKHFVGHRGRCGCAVGVSLSGFFNTFLGVCDIPNTLIS